MIALSLEQIADVVGGQLSTPVHPAAVGTRESIADHVVRRVTIDSRDAAPGALFVALPGARTDGHRFVAQAIAAGAAGALVAHDHLATVPADTAAVIVDDPADALLALGVWVRETVAPLVVAVTGSNGKTTTKDLIAAAATSLRVVANVGSFNNELGVPLTCCRLEHDTDVLVSELGMRGSGQIAHLTGLLRPDIGVVTSVAPVHLELLGSLDAITDAKAELVEGLSEDGVAVLAADDPRVAAMARRTPARVVTFGRGDDADWRARDVVLDECARATFTLECQAGTAIVRVPVPGLHNVGNALAALATVVEAGVALDDAVAGLAEATISSWRLQLQQIGELRVLNDAYNANPTSTIAALRTLSALPTTGRRIAVLGTMAEIGQTSASEHRRVGTTLAQLGTDMLIAVGDDAAAIRDGADAEDPDGAAARTTVDGVDDAADLLARTVRPGDVVLVKASRSAALDGVVAALEQRLSARTTAGEHAP